MRVMQVFLQVVFERFIWNRVYLEELFFPDCKELTIDELCVLLWQQL